MDEDESPYIIEITADEPPVPLDESRIRQAVERTLRRHRCSRADVSIALVDDQRIARLNQQFLGHMGPTDCITFNLADDHDDCQGANIDGEIVISWQTAEREARTRGRDAMSEILLYAIHGTLHLLGMDDASADQADAMHLIEDEILAGMGLGCVFANEATA